MSDGRIKLANQGPQAFSLPEIGKIKIGYKEKNAAGKEYPKSSDHFIFDGPYAEKAKQIIGDNKSKLQVVFASDVVRDSCYERFEAYTPSGVRLATGDGTKFEVWDDEAPNKDSKTGKGNYVKDVDASDPRVQAIKNQLRRTLTLKFVLPELDGLHGVWKFSTRAKASSIDHIISMFDYVMEKAGRVSGIPFELFVTMATKKTPLGVTNFPVVNLVPNLSNENMEQIKTYLSSVSFGTLGTLDESKIKALVAESSKKQPLEIGDKAPEKKASVVDATENQEEDFFNTDPSGQMKIK